MNVKLLAAAVSIASLCWLGLSFATPNEVPAEERLETYPSIEGSAPGPVSAEHPDSHRLGSVVEEDVALPAWSEGESADPGRLLVLLGK